MKNRWSLWGALLGGVLAAASAWSFMTAQKAQAARGEQTVPVLRAAHYIKAGRPITRSDVNVVVVPGAYQEPTAITAIDQLMGPDSEPVFVARIGITEGAQITAYSLVDRRVEAGLSWMLPGHAVAATVSLAPPDAVGGMVRPGDLVHVFVTFSSQPGWSRPETRLLAPDIRVLGVDGMLWQPDTLFSRANDKQMLESHDIQVTLEVDPETAARVLFADQNGRITLAMTSAFAEKGRSKINAQFEDFR